MRVVPTFLVVLLAATTAPATAQPSGGPDASIAKARAAKVDTKVFGIPLGEPLRLPVCEPLDAVGGGSATCLFEQPFRELTAAFLGPLGLEADPSQVTVMLAKASCPAWAAQCQFTGTLHEGLLVAIAIATHGRGPEQKILSDLRAKYGQPTGFEVHTITPSAGEPYKVHNPVWAGLPGLHVEYTVVGTGGEGVLRTDQGLVRVETERAYRRRAAEEQEAARPKL
jgi:hypothetical protein